ncbi:MAG TPA: hypothetical protein PLK30_23790 [Blastocatellia bacterium]|nr:hypothetical protein [Blastocatellia bacterium]
MALMNDGIHQISKRSLLQQQNAEAARQELKQSASTLLESGFPLTSELLLLKSFTLIGDACSLCPPFFALLEWRSKAADCN